MSTRMWRWFQIVSPVIELLEIEGVTGESTAIQILWSTEVKLFRTLSKQTPLKIL